MTDEVSTPKFLSIRQLSGRLGISRTTIWREARRNPDFPRKVQLSPNRVGFLSTAVDCWIADQQAASLARTAAATACAEVSDESPV